MAHRSKPDTGGAEATNATTGALLQDRALRAALWAALRLPYERRVPLFGAIAQKAASRLTSYHQRMLENLDYVWPDLSEARRSEIAAAAGNNFGRALIEHFSMADLARRMDGVAPTGPGLQTLQAAAEQGRPVVLVTGHFGNYEAARLCLIKQGWNVGALYRPMGNPYINRTYVDVAEKVGGGPLFPQGRQGMGQLLRHLKNGGAAIILNDLYVGGGVEMPFLGKPAMTGLSAAELALKLRAPLIPFYGIRAPDGLTFRVEVEPEIPASDAEAMTAAFNRSIEARIEAHPGQWFWIHRRWKRKWNGGKGMKPGLHPAALPRRKSS
ncbi:lysophospholipid acyltransferase family protein [Tropicimonas isoalkanivorans]|uniref:KDO2-lipid IV(A) lauroyltransferase n=1 Tax=Tropicimonas isoalkanivorans TaxID=441112 RepID=A0A1I1D8G3_9RHOB|nr:lysophospholipid acyltransferase family protein [Tropicimonas isoalkanivorans]SFB70682.1 KDO2-lipid IV(A) lauroyltransferase [Tropicimonas isoalkanivorans]